MAEHKDVKVPASGLIDTELEAFLNTDPQKGLTAEDVQERLIKFGYNAIEQIKKPLWKKFLAYFIDPIAILIEIAMIFSAVVQDWVDFGIIGGLLVINALIGFLEEAKAENAIEALQKTLSLKSKALRNGEFKEVDSSELVPGDIISVRIGDIVPADCKLLGLTFTFTPSKEPLLLDEAALTGESLPVSKYRDDLIYSSSICKQGQMLAMVTKTGIRTFIGRAANLINVTQDKSHFQIIVGQLGYFLIIITIVAVIIIFIVKSITKERPVGASATANLYLTLLQEVVVLTVAAIPVGLPTVLSVTMAVGAKQLSAKNVIVKRLTAIEELSAVQILCSDKTGTLTLNDLTIDKPFLAVNKSTNMKYTDDEILLFAFLSSEHIPTDPIELTIHRDAKAKSSFLKTANADGSFPGYEIQEFIPFNPDTKMTKATVKDTVRNQDYIVAKGAPQVITKLVGGHPEADAAVLTMAKAGLRALGVAICHDDNWELVGMISLLDPPRPDSKQTIVETLELGVQVKMVTGDQLPIAKEVARRLGMSPAILDATCLNDTSIPENELIRRCERADGFAQVVPENKFRVVELLQKKRNRLVGMTGDGVNDAPALKKANVGIAVHGCTDAARSASDIVLLAPGLSTIVDGIKISRAIFQRMRSYALYRISSTVHFLIFFFITILAFNWSLPARQIILIAMLNDFATLVISVDNALISPRPDKWRLGQLMTLSAIIGVLLTCTSFILYFFAKYGIKVTEDQLLTIMYLQISSCPHFMIFGTRLTDHFWKNKPSNLFIFAIVATQIFAMFISIFGLPLITVPVGWGWGIGIMCYSTICFMLIDFVKVYVIAKWNFELTVKLFPTKSRVRELEIRKKDAQSGIRFNKNLKTFKKSVKLIETVSYWQRLPTQKDSSEL